ncbi:hypothetical protein, partial [Segatella sp.]|uniref:hypothetical protein n=1 Tax=Segatella sp. TaxID=2974253 RepID=UPI003AB6A72F
SLFSFNIIEKRKKELFLRFLKEKVYICKRIADIKKIYRYEEGKEFFRNCFSEEGIGKLIGR